MTTITAVEISAACDELTRLQDRNAKLEAVVRSIANMWPDPDCSPNIFEVSGINDGRSRALIAGYAVQYARQCLGMPYHSFPAAVAV
jgi:hypothetical protein